MTTELIKLKVRIESSNNENSKRIVDSFIQACLNLDCTLLEPLINEDDLFEDLDKYRFLASIKQQFDWAIARGAKDIKMKKGKCGMCVRGHSTYEFYGNKSTPEFAYVINTKSQVVKDIFLCNFSSGMK